MVLRPGCFSDIVNAHLIFLSILYVKSMFHYQIRCKLNLIGKYEVYPQLFQNAFPVQCLKQGDGRNIIETFSGKTIDVRQYKIDLRLSQSIEGSSFFQYFPHIDMVILDMALLPGRKRIAVEDSRSLFSSERAFFKRSRIGEF